MLRRTAMPWLNDDILGEHEAQPRSVRKAGFKGLVGHSDTEEMAKEYHEYKHGGGLDENEWDDTYPELTHDEHRHLDEHNDYPDTYHARHEQAYADRMSEKWKDEVPDHLDDHLSHFVQEHGSRADWEKGGGKLGRVDLSHGVYATQSHVSQFHINRYLHAPNDKAWYLKHGGADHEYLGNDHPMFVTHQGRLHAVEGHHRIAAALQRGDTHIQGWHFDLDKHPISNESDIHKRPDGTRVWGPTDAPCPDCEAHAANARELASAHK